MLRADISQVEALSGLRRRFEEADGIGPEAVPFDSNTRR